MYSGYHTYPCVTFVSFNYALNIWRVQYIQKMAEQGDDTYIKCSRCKCKYHNNDESIKDNFGFNRLGETYKCCVKCGDRWKQRRQELIRTADESNGTVKHCNRCYKNKPVIDFVCPNGKSYNACYPCLERKYGQINK